MAWTGNSIEFIGRGGHVSRTGQEDYVCSGKNSCNTFFCVPLPRQKDGKLVCPHCGNTQFSRIGQQNNNRSKR